MKSSNCTIPRRVVRAPHFLETMGWYKDIRSVSHSNFKPLISLVSIVTSMMFPAKFLFFIFMSLWSNVTVTGIQRDTRPTLTISRHLNITEFGTIADADRARAKVLESEGLEKASGLSKRASSFSIWNTGVRVDDHLISRIILNISIINRFNISPLLVLATLQQNVRNSSSSRIDWRLP